MELRQEDIAEIVRIFNESELVELRLELGGNRLYLSKQAGGLARWEDAPARAQPGSASLEPAPAEPPAQQASPAAGPASPEPSSAAPDPARAPAGQPTAEPAAGTSLAEIRSPLLGVFYRRPAPDKPAFVEIGSEVGVDDPVCIIDVMKMFSRVPAGVAGRVVEILAQDGQLVEHGQVLMRLEPR